MPHCPPSPSAFLISSPVSGLYTIPTSLIPASNTASIAKWIMGLLAIGIRCLLLVCVIGLSLVPLPPLVMSAFMYVPFCTVPCACFMKQTLYLIKESIVYQLPLLNPHQLPFVNPIFMKQTAHVLHHHRLCNNYPVIG